MLAPASSAVKLAMSAARELRIASAAVVRRRSTTWPRSEPGCSPGQKEDMDVD